MPFCCALWTRLIVQELFRKKRHVITIIAMITILLILNNTESHSIMCFMENSMWSNNNGFIIGKISYGYWIYQLTRNLHIDNVWEMHVIFQTAYYVGCVILTPLSHIPENINILILLSPIGCIWKPHSCPALLILAHSTFITKINLAKKERKKKLQYGNTEKLVLWLCEKESELRVINFTKNRNSALSHTHTYVLLSRWENSDIVSGTRERLWWYISRSLLSTALSLAVCVSVWVMPFLACWKKAAKFLISMLPFLCLQ